MLIEDKELTIYEALERSYVNNPSKNFILYHDTAITYEEAYKLSNGFAEFLMVSGIRKGDKVCFLLPRIPELILSFLGIIKAGAIPVPVNYTLSKREIMSFISRVSPSVIIINDKLLTSLDPEILVRKDVKIICTGKENYGYIPWNRACYLSNKKIENKKDCNEIAYLNYTTGSTGIPKGAIAKHSNIYWNTRSAVEAMQIRHGDVHLCMFASFAHPHELFARALHTGGTLVLLEEIKPKTIAQTIIDKSVTCMMGLAPMYENLLSVLEYKTYDLNSLRIPESGGMYTRNELIRRFKQKVGVPIIPVWGSTETTGVAIANHPGKPILPGSIGKPCISYEVRIVDENNRELKNGEIGEMIFKGPAVVKGYYECSSNSHLSFRDGWYYSGDLGKRDREGNFYFVERKTGMMKVAGLKVYPLEIELALMEHPDIKEVAIISAKDRLRGEVPKAIVVTKNGKELTKRDIIEFCKGRLPQYKLPRIVEIRESLPKTGSGKINKKVLQMEYL